MKKLLFTSLYLILLMTSLSAGSDDYSFKNYINRTYKVSDDKIRDYYIVASKPQTLEEGFEYLNSGEGNLDKGTVFFALASILSAYPSNDYNSDIKRYVQKVEESHVQGNPLQRLSNTYNELAIIGSDYTLKLLQERATYEFWKGREMPSVTGSFSDMSNEPFTVNAMSSAINALGRHPSPEAEAFLLNLKDEKRYKDDLVLSKAESFDYALNARRDLAYYRSKIDKALALKESIFGPEQTAGEVGEKPPVEALEMAEVIEESTVPEPETGKPIEVKTAEPSEEPTEQSSNCWLWLIGALVVVGGIALAVRRKN